MTVDAHDAVLVSRRVPPVPVFEGRDATICVEYVNAIEAGRGEEIEMGCLLLSAACVHVWMKEERVDESADGEAWWYHRGWICALDSWNRNQKDRKGSG